MLGSGRRGDLVSAPSPKRTWKFASTHRLLDAAHLMRCMQHSRRMSLVTAPISPLYPPGNLFVRRNFTITRKVRVPVSLTRTLTSGGHPKLVSAEKNTKDVAARSSNVAAK